MTSDYAYQYIIKNWKVFPDIIDTLLKKPKQTFNILHVKTYPQTDPIYEKLTHKPDYWIFTFIRLVEYDDDVFIFFSNRDKIKTLKRIEVDSKKALEGTCFVNSHTKCIFGANRISKGLTAECNFIVFTEDIPYLYVEWSNGTIMNLKENYDLAEKISNSESHDPVLKRILKKFLENNVKKLELEDKLLKCLNSLPDNIFKPIFEYLENNNYSDKSYKESVLLIPENILNDIVFDINKNKNDVCYMIENCLREFIKKLRNKKKLAKKRIKKKLKNKSLLYENLNEN